MQPTLHENVIVIAIVIVIVRRTAEPTQTIRNHRPHGFASIPMCTPQAQQGQRRTLCW